MNTCEPHSRLLSCTIIERSLPPHIWLFDRVVSLFDPYEIKLLRVLTDWSTECCGNPDWHEYEIYAAVEDIDHSRTKTSSPQTNGIVERFHNALNL